ncbi:MAG: hypothetical protein P4K94_11805 [Terracidiphilus sp.]|nr:hypothetical protein [Terracidiphilus sp.]
MKNALKLKTFGVVAFLGTGLLLSGCKSAPELTQANALALIQAKYDQTPAVGVNIAVNDLGMRQGAEAKYWTRTTVYPNKIWADFTLTADGKKAIKLSSGGDVIQWRPETADDKQYALIVTTAVANHLKARDLEAVQDDAGGKGVSFTESVDLTGVPDALQNMAHNPGNKLSTKRQAEFVLDGGAWKLNSIQ